MTEGSVWRHIVRFALPVFWGNLFQQLYNVVDSLVVGNFLGSDALAAVGSSSHLIFLLVGLFSGIFTGASVVISRYYGARDDASVRTAVHTTVAFGLVAGVVITIAGVLLTPRLLIWMGTPESVLPNSILYSASTSAASSSSSSTTRRRASSRPWATAVIPCIT